MRFAVVVVALVAVAHLAACRGGRFGPPQDTVDSGFLVVDSGLQDGGDAGEGEGEGEGSAGEGEGEGDDVDAGEPADGGHTFPHGDGGPPPGFDAGPHP